jgi:putative SOS response-associated peptidase YedK
MESMIACQLALPSGIISWYPVSTKVNNVKNDGAELVVQT